MNARTATTQLMTTKAMLSGSIEQMVSAMEEELANGAVMTPAMQWNLVEIMRGWHGLALALEGEGEATTPEPPASVQLAVVGGSEHVTSNEKARPYET